MKITARKDLTPLKAAAKREIDAAAEAILLTQITPGFTISKIYSAKQREAHTFLADGTVGRLMQAEIGINGATAADIAALWLSMEEQWYDAAAVIEPMRQAAKQAVNAATTPAEIEAAKQVNWPVIV